MSQKGAEWGQGLLARMARLGILEIDIEERFIRGGGKGGQKINKTSSCVQLLHRPSGIEVRCQNERSQLLNRTVARAELCSKLEARVTKQTEEAARSKHRIRKQKQRRSKGAKERILHAKKIRSVRKRTRSDKGAE